MERRITSMLVGLVVVACAGGCRGGSGVHADRTAGSADTLAIVPISAVPGRSPAIREDETQRKDAPKMSATDEQIRELEAQIRELEALVERDPSSKAQIDAQVKNLRSVQELLRKNAPAMDANRAARPPLSAEMKTFFTPLTPVAIPTWFPDTTLHSEVKVEEMRCPTGAKVYSSPSSINCSIPGVPGHSLAVSHGLALGFDTSGKLSSQSFFERGDLKWEIRYHLTGGREKVGFYGGGTEETDSREQGVQTRFSPSGVVIAQTEYVNGKKNGWRKAWEADGYPIGATRYRSDVEVESALPNGTHTQSSNQ